MPAGRRARVAVFSGPTATVLNTPPLRTSQRVAEGDSRGELLRAQRLAAPVTVYVEAFSAHPLERDAEHLYADPDGYVDASGRFRAGPDGPDCKPVYKVELRPEDGLYLLPYVARRADGSPWDADADAPDAPEGRSRQPFFPDARRLFEEIDRFGLDSDGRNGTLSRLADYDFVRAAPPAGYRRGLVEPEGTDDGRGDSEPERAGVDYFPYRPYHLRREPGRAVLARITNVVRSTLAGDRYRGALWLEGSPFLEETLYWLNLTVPASVPIVGVASPDWAHGVIGNVGDRNVLDAVRYVVSGAWMDDAGADRLGAVLIHSGRIIAAREAQKADARGPGYEPAGGLGGMLGAISQVGAVTISFVPTRLHTWTSEVALEHAPRQLRIAVREGDGIASVPVRPFTESGELREELIPRVAIVKYGRYAAESSDREATTEVEVAARIDRNLADAVPSGFVAEGGSPHGHLSGPLEAALERAVLRGMPVVKVGRGNAGGVVPGDRIRLGSGRFAIAGNNLSATKARILLMACLLRFGSLPVPGDPDRPTPAEVEAIHRALAEYQRVFDTH